MDIRSLMPSFLRTLIPYESPNEGAPEGTVWLNTNEYPTATKYEMRFETLNSSATGFISQPLCAICRRKARRGAGDPRGR